MDVVAGETWELDSGYRVVTCIAFGRVMWLVANARVSWDWDLSRRSTSRRYNYSSRCFGRAARSNRGTDAWSWSGWWRDWWVF
jgi:hypothetical protein